MLGFASSIQPMSHPFTVTIDIADYEGVPAAEMAVPDPAHKAEAKACLLETIRNASKVDELVPWTREELYDR
ncbi:hypothetical protein AGMMS50256_26840 [Betaproteobacteria bacterium]|nr:hypothetical protein AGMMS50256_26840 [Betaproteobacteria bacterium]